MKTLRFPVTFVLAAIVAACATAAVQEAELQAAAVVARDAEIGWLSRGIGNSLAPTPSAKLGVVDFTDRDGKATDLGKFLAGELAAKITSQKKVQVIDRGQVEKVLKEQRPAVTAIRDRKEAMKAGPLLGATVIATGTTTDLGNKIRLDVRTMSVKTGEVLFTGMIVIAKDEQVKMLTGETVPLASQPSGTSPAAGQPIVASVVTTTMKKEEKVKEQTKALPGAAALPASQPSATPATPGPPIVQALSTATIAKAEQAKMVPAGTPPMAGMQPGAAAPAGQPAGTSPARDLTGTWKFVCCSGKYWGEIGLAMGAGNRFAGTFYDMANKSGGTIDGTVTGNTVQFTRNQGEQDYKLTLGEDGKRMAGSFAGSRDGSAGTEVSMIRKDTLEAGRRGYSEWRSAEEFGREMELQWKDEYYPMYVEGRLHQGRSEFRAALQPFPKMMWWFSWWYDQTQSAYEGIKRQMIADGFKEISVQVFTDKDGIQKYQTCWIKYHV